MSATGSTTATSTTLTTATVTNTYKNTGTETDTLTIAAAAATTTTATPMLLLLLLLLMVVALQLLSPLLSILPPSLRLQLLLPPPPPPITTSIARVRTPNLRTGSTGVAEGVGHVSSTTRRNGPRRLNLPRPRTRTPYVEQDGDGVWC